MADHEPILFLVSRGLLEHKDRMGGALWEYLWFLDRVTKDDPDGNGKFNGLVLGGAPFKAEVIAHDLHEHVKTVLQNVRKLEAEGYIIRKRHAGNLCSFTVTNSKKWFWRRRIENAPSGGVRRSETTPSEGAKPLPRGSETTPAYKERHDSDTTKNKNRRPSAFDPTSLELPDWLPRDSWLEWCQHRKEIKKPLTSLAARKSITELDRARRDGYSAKVVIDHCIAGSYQGLFPPKEGKKATPAYRERETRAESATRLAREKARVM